MPEDFATATAPGPTPAPLRGRDLAVAAAAYAAIALYVSYPLVASLATTLCGSLYDPAQHLWIMKWYQRCLIEGRSPVICPDLQYPSGAPLGNFSPLHLQALLFIPLSLALGNDVLGFNLVWLFAMVTTGLGTFALAWQATRDKPCSAFAGMLAMMSTPMMFHGRGHLELVTLGGFPLFLAGWMRFVDRPTKGRLAAAAALYVLVALCAAYYVVFAVVPAALYVAWEAGRQREGPRRWARGRLPWLVGFGGLVLPALAAVFGSHLWAAAHGFATARSTSEFNEFGAPPWTYLAPTPLHALAKLLPTDPYAAAGYLPTINERASYLGAVTIALMLLAAARRERFARRGYLWAAFGLLVLLSWGGAVKVGSWAVALPAGWIKEHGLLFAMIRVPARFNLFAGVIAAVIAAAGLRGLLARIARPSARSAVYLGLAFAAMADLSTGSWWNYPVPEPPACYRAILDRDPRAAFVEVPQYTSGGSMLYTVAGYWQSIHRGRTNAGYSGNPNRPMDDLVTWNSPFLADSLADPNYLADPDWMTVDVVGGVGFRDYAWLYLTQGGYRYVVLHQWPGYAPGFPEKLAKLKALLEPAKVFEDEKAAVYDRERMAPPSRPVALTTEGWRSCARKRMIRAVGKTGGLVVYNPEAGKPVSLALCASGFRRRRTAVLLRDGRELARWTIPPFAFGTYRTPPLLLPAGISRLVLECDGESAPARPAQYARDFDPRPYSLAVAGIAVSSEARPPEPPTLEVAAQPRPGRGRY